MADIKCVEHIIRKYANKTDTVRLAELADRFLEAKEGKNKPAFMSETQFMEQEIKEAFDRLYEERDYVLKSIMYAAIKKSEVNEFINNFTNKFDEETGKVVGRLKGRTEAEGLSAMLIGSNRPIEGARQSVDARARALESSFTNEVIANLTAIKDSNGMEAMSKLESKDFQMEVAREKAALPLQEGYHNYLDTDSAAMKTAKYLDNLQKSMIVQQNHYGGGIKLLPGYIERNNHDMFKVSGNRSIWQSLKNLGRGIMGDRQVVRDKAREDWVDFIYDRLDRKETFKDLKTEWDRLDPTTGETGKVVKDRLREIWYDLAVGRHLVNTKEQSQGTFNVYADIAKKVSQSRVLHMKDADSWMQYNERFGTGDLLASVMDNIRRSSQNIAVMEKLGPVPEQVFNEILGKLDHKAKQMELNAKTEEQKQAAEFLRKDLEGRHRNRLKNHFKEAIGETRIPGDISVARIGAGIRKWQNLAKLGRAFISSLADVPLFAKEVQRQTGSYMKGYATALSNIPKIFNKKDRIAFSDMLGVGIDAMRNDLIARFSLNEIPGGKMTKWQNAMFKWTLLQQWTDSFKVASATMSSHEMSTMVGKTWADLGRGTKSNKSMKKMLKLYGIDSGKWDLIRKYGIGEVDGKQFVVPKFMNNIDPGDIAKHLGIGTQSAADWRRINFFKRELEMDLRTFFNDRADFAVATPSGRERSFLTRGSKPGTAAGEAFRFIAQFKSFPITVTNKLIGGDVRSLNAEGRGFKDTFWDISRNGKGTMFHYLLGLTSFGMLTLSLKNLANGQKTALEVLIEDPLSKESAKLLSEAAIQGGFAGVYGDLIFGDTRGYGRGVMETLLGPVPAAAGEFVNNLKDTTVAVFDPDKDIPWKSWIYFAKNNNPLWQMNTWWTKWAMDYGMWYSMLEASDPGSLRDMERNLKKRNREFFNPIRPTKTRLDLFE